MNKVTVIAKRVGQHPVVEEIDNKLEAFQEFVGGYIESLTISPKDRVSFILNEDGIALGLKPNVSVLGTDILGDVLITGYDENGDNRSLTEQEIAVLLNMFKKID